jgi:hypothetical protein
VQVGTDEGRSEGWTEGIPDAVGAWELVGAELGALEVEGEIDGDNDGALEIVGEEDVDGLPEGCIDPLELPLPPFAPLPLNARPGKAPKTSEKRSDSKMMVVPVLVFMMKKKGVGKIMRRGD